jgi:DNA-binding IclR family transcriptional regulator
MTDHTTDRILYALYCLSRDTCHIDASELARAVGVSPTLAAGALLTLEHAGLVDATRARLTMLGLARAAALGARGSGGPAIDLARAKPRAQPLAAANVAAQAHEPAPSSAVCCERTTSSQASHRAQTMHEASDQQLPASAATNAPPSAN